MKLFLAAHTNRIDYEKPNQIESPPIYSVRKQADPYTWSLEAPNDKLIELSFQYYSEGLKVLFSMFFI